MAFETVNLHLEITLAADQAWQHKRSRRELRIRGVDEDTGEVAVTQDFGDGYLYELALRRDYQPVSGPGISA